MAAQLTCYELLTAVRESGVVEETNLESFLAQWEQDAQNQDAQHLAEGMQKTGLITRFQKEMLLQGKRRGYIIADKYILLDHIGAGGMGSVYLCQHRIMHRRVAIKVLPTAFAKDPEYLQRFHREARAAAALDHPNIVRAFDVDHDDKIHFLVMEYVDGTSLHNLVTDEGPLAVQRAADLIAQAASGLQHAHEAGLVHRDIKPGNLLVDRKGTLKVLDMGLALFFQEQGKSLTQQYDANAVLGTAEYLAPEQAVDSHGVDIRADIYSLGLTFYFLLTGKSPYGEEGTLAQKLLWHQMREPKSVREFRSDVPEGLQAVISKMLAKDREARYQTPIEVARALEPWVRGVASQTPPPLPRPSVQAAKSTARRAPETMSGSESETKDAVRTRKKPLSDSESGARSRKNLADSDSKRARTRERDAEDDDQPKKGPRSSGKHRRARAAEKSIFARQDVIIASIGVVLLIAVLTGIYLFARGNASPAPSELAQGPPVEQKNEPPVVEVKPEPKQEVPPPKVEIPEKKTEPKIDPPIVKEITPEPKKEPPKKEPPKTKPPVKPTPPVKESLADYFPKVGATLFYDVATYVPGNKTIGTMVRNKWEFKNPTDSKEIKEKELMDSILIESTAVRIGQIDGTLLKGGKVVWAGGTQGRASVFLRSAGGHFEFGQQVPKSKTIFWEPVLPLAAAEKDTWKLPLPNGDVKNYSVLKIDKAKNTVIIRSTMPAQPEGELVTVQTYLKGKGEVSRTDSLEKAGRPQLLAEKKLVDQ